MNESGQQHETKEDVRTLYQQGFGLRQIARLTGKSPTTIKRSLQRNGIYQGGEHATIPDRNAHDFRQWHKENCNVFVGDRGDAAVDFREGGGALTCPVPPHLFGKLIKMTVTIQPNNAAAHIALGKRTADGVFHATHLTVVRLLIPQPYHHKMRMQPGDLFCIAGGAGTVLLSDLSIVELPEPPPLPSPDLLTWQSENGASVQATRNGWKVTFPSEDSRLCITFPFDRALSFSVECFLSSPHAGTVHCTLQYEDGQHEDARTLQWSDQPTTLRVRTHRCQGETMIELKGSAPVYALSPLTLLIRNVTMAGEAGEVVALPLPPEPIKESDA